MTREELEHAIRAACDIAQDHEVYVFGSQSILGQHPDATPTLRVSVDVDISPKNQVARCADLDLVKWLRGSYAIPAQDPEDIERAQQEISDAEDKPN